MSQARFISSHRKQRRTLQYDNRPDENPHCYPPCPSGLAKGRLTVVSPLMASYGVVSALLSVATGEKMTAAAATVIGLGLAIAGAIPVGDFGKNVISGKNIRLVACYRSGPALRDRLWLQGKYSLPTFSPLATLWIYYVAVTTIVAFMCLMRHKSIVLRGVKNIGLVLGTALIDHHQFKGPNS